MKTKLLKKLRRKYVIIYRPGKGVYEVIIPVFTTKASVGWPDLISARAYRRENLLKEARGKYSKYGKQYKIN